MKKSLPVTILLVALSAMTASAQEAKVGKMSVGIKGGLRISTLKGDSLAVIVEDMDHAATVPSNKSWTGAGFGAFVSYSISQSIAIQPELLYIKKGSKFTFSDGGTTTAKSAWLEIPLLLKFSLPLKGGGIVPAFFAGPFVGIVTSAEFQQHGFAVTSEAPADFDTKDSLNSTDFGITFGSQLGYKLLEGEIFLDARYDVGMTKILKSGAFNRPHSEADAETRALLMFVGYRFDI